MTAPSIDITPVTGALGAEIAGVDLSKPLSNEVFSDIYQAFLDHLVIFFRDQNMTPEQHRDFAARFFKLEAHPFVQSLDGIPEIIEIIKEPDEHKNWGGPWHSDVTFKEEPSIGAVLYARDVPGYGGDTLFANMYLAYETLSDGLKAMIEGVNAVHESGEPSNYTNYYKSMRGKAEATAIESSVHPVVRTHPETGRKALFVNGGFTRRFENMTEEESRPLLEYLWTHASRPEFTCRQHWAQGSIAVWDNRVTMHHAVDDDFRALQNGQGFRRVMHRATMAGQPPH